LLKKYFKKVCNEVFQSQLLLSKAGKTEKSQQCKLDYRFNEKAFSLKSTHLFNYFSLELHMKNLLNRLSMGMATVAILGFGIFAQSCSQLTDSTPVTSTVGTSEQVATLANPTTNDLAQYVMNVGDFSYEQAMFPPIGDNGRDSSRGGGAVRGPRFRPLPIPCLELTTEQMEQIKTWMRETDAQNKLANQQFREALDAIRKQDSAAVAAFRAQTSVLEKQLRDASMALRQQMNDIRTQVRAGTLSEADARTQMKALMDKFNADTKDVRDQLAALRKAFNDSMAPSRAARQAAEKALQDAIKANQDALYAKIVGSLNDKQKEIWNLWLSGKNPCPGRGPRG
jgi:Spy/CpxP family protein refolding chaperone